MTAKILLSFRTHRDYYLKPSVFSCMQKYRIKELNTLLCLSITINFWKKGNPIIFINWSAIFSLVLIRLQYLGDKKQQSWFGKLPISCANSISRDFAPDKVFHQLAIISIWSWSELPPPQIYAPEQFSTWLFLCTFPAFIEMVFNYLVSKNCHLELPFFLDL